MKPTRFLPPLFLLFLLAFFFWTQKSNIGTLRNGWLQILSPFFYAGSSAQRQIGTLGKKLKTLDQLEEEYRLLINENERLQAENQVLHHYEKEVVQLRQALSFQQDSAFLLLPAELITHDSATWWDTIKINKGSQDGVAIDQVVVTSQGLVGKVIEVASHLSIVLLVTDENCKVAANVEGTQEQGIVSGMRIPNGEIQLSFLSKLSELHPGQKVYTAGVIGGVFPSGIAIGTIKSFHVSELDGHAILEPAVNLNELKNLFVLVGAK
jgi:rod shape-determining protein MreC